MIGCILLIAMKVIRLIKYVKIRIFKMQMRHLYKFGLIHLLLQNIEYWIKPGL